MDGSFTESPLDSALRLADTHGWYVFPVKVTPLPNGKSNKSPLIKWGDGASNDPDVIEAMVTSKKGVPAWECATHGRMTSGEHKGQARYVRSGERSNGEWK
ncbi:hypothetical protein [Ruegeria arenilitoris]|uniref:hypothetical protein n=1 Tax=Ruegeria arenilitoris TaxID=1173585 RepID=UPI00147FF851|nr:hypothetical protein [Ruegeria arenilitoris]